MSLYRYQYSHCSIFHSFCNLTNRRPNDISDIASMAYLPISFFKQQEIKSGQWPHQKIYRSSATSTTVPSRHFIRDVKAYLDHAVRSFNAHYGDVSQYCFLALLPSYLERPDSSLIDMVHHFINCSIYQESRFYLYDTTALKNQLLSNIDNKIPTILWGVTYALLDFAEEHSMDLSEIIIMETGGMKGRRAEMPKKQIHDLLCTSFNVDRIHSEYGMTELLSQAYSSSDGLFDVPRSMQVSIRAVDDPFLEVLPGQRGRIYIIDLANIDSCAFIATDDLGIINANGQMKILGRLDGSEQRGCNLMMEG